MKSINIAIVGCGMIAQSEYLDVFKRSRWLNLTACCDLLPERAETLCMAAKEAGLETPVSKTFDEVLADNNVDMIFNLTTPRAHFPINMQALEAGKHVYGEKPLAVTCEDGRKLLETAKNKGVRLGCAPDTFLGAGHQTARALIDSGKIGTPSSATIFVMSGGPDGYHDDPEFFYQAGGGPLFDLCVYYITNTVQLLGPVKRISAFTKITFPERKILSKKKYGQMMKVDVPTHVAGIMEFENGVICTLTTSFDILGAHNLPSIEIHGTEGSLTIPDSNCFNDKPQFHAARSRDPWEAIEQTHGLVNGCRGFGAADMAAAIHNNRPHRTSGELAYHVLDIMNTFYDSADAGQVLDVKSTITRPAMIPGLLNDIED